MFFHFIKTLFFLVLTLFHIISIKKFKEKLFSFLKKIKNVDEVVNNFWNKEIKNINIWYTNQKQVDDVIISASPKFLIENALKRINPKAFVIATNMNKENGKIVGENCKGEEKVKQLNLIGITSFEKCYTDSLNDFPILDMAKEKYIVCGKKVYKFGEQKPTLPVKIKYFIKQLRIKHYIKNGLILLPLFFSGELQNAQKIYVICWALVSFCCLSSFVYIINDLLDVKKDRKHSKKRKRPIASYMIKPYEAIILAIVLLGATIFINLYLIKPTLLSLSLLGIYTVLNFLYSLIFKKIPIIDVYVLSCCYLLRLLYGGSVVGVGISKWLYLTVLCASLYIGLGKRRNEIKQESQETRQVNKFYSYNFLDKNMYACMVLSMAFYSLWAIDVKSSDINILNCFILIVTITIMYFILMRYSLNIENEKNSGNPVEILFKDKLLIICVILFIFMICLSIYVPIPNFLN